MKSTLQLLEEMHLVEQGSHFPAQLSGGEQQRIALARAMIHAPQLVLADEPTGALDTKTSYEVMDLIQGIHEEGRTILIVTHEHDIAQMTERIVTLKDGLIIDDTRVDRVKAVSNV